MGDPNFDSFLKQIHQYFIHIKLRYRLIQPKSKCNFMLYKSLLYVMLWHATELIRGIWGEMSEWLTSYNRDARK